MFASGAPSPGVSRALGAGGVGKKLGKLKESRKALEELGRTEVFEGDNSDKDVGIGHLFTQPAPQGDDQAVFAHTVMAPAPSWEEGV